MVAACVIIRVLTTSMGWVARHATSAELWVCVCVRMIVRDRGVMAWTGAGVKMIVRIRGGAVVAAWWRRGGGVVAAW